MLGMGDIPFIDEQREELDMGIVLGTAHFPEVALIETREVEVADLQRVDAKGGKLRGQFQQRKCPSAMRCGGNALCVVGSIDLRIAKSAVQTPGGNR
jgi:hypothetical protein